MVMLRNKLIIASGLLGLALLFGQNPTVNAAACVPPPTDYGTVTSTVSVASAGSYRVWSRIMAPDTTNNSYQLEIDGNTCITVGDNAIPANTWTWVDYQDGAPTTKTNITLSAGSHTFKMIGREASVKLDRILFLNASDTCLTAQPNGTGDNCTTTTGTDTTPPSVPTDLTAVVGSGGNTVVLDWTDSSDNNVPGTGEYLIKRGGATIAQTPACFSSQTTPCSPMNYSSYTDTTVVTGTSYTYTIVAVDAAGNSSAASASASVTVGGGTQFRREDINRDGRVSLADFIVLKNNFGKCGDAVTDPRAEQTNDGCITLADFIKVKNAFGS